MPFWFFFVFYPCLQVQLRYWPSYSHICIPVWYSTPTSREENACRIHNVCSIHPFMSPKEIQKSPFETFSFWETSPKLLGQDEDTLLGCINILSSLSRLSLWCTCTQAPNTRICTFTQTCILLYYTVCALLFLPARMYRLQILVGERRDYFILCHSLLIQVQTHCRCSIN